MLNQKEILKALQEIERANGALTPQAVVDAARRRSHPLHDYFEWNNEVAGEKYRLEQARALIRSVRVVIETRSAPIRTVYYVRDPRRPPEEQGYVSLPVLRSDEELARDAILREFERAAAALERAKSLARAVEAETVIDALVRQIVSSRDALWPSLASPPT